MAFRVKRRSKPVPSRQRKPSKRKRETREIDKNIDRVDSNFDLSSEQDKELLTSEKEFHSKLGQLSETDPEFYTFLQKNDKSLFEILSDSESSSIEESEIDDSQDSDDNQDSDNMESTVETITVTKDMINKWKEDLKRSHSIMSLTELTAALHCAIISIIKSGEEQPTKPLLPHSNHYLIQDGGIFNSLILSCLQLVCQTLENHLPVPPSSSTKFSLPSTSKKWGRLRLVIKSYLIDIMQLLVGVTDSTMVCALLRHVDGLWIYYCCFPKLSRHLCKHLIKIWSHGGGTGDDGTSVLSFLILRKIFIRMNYHKQEDLLKCLYLAYIRNSKYTNVKTIPHIRFMCGCLIDFLSLSPDHAYQLIFIYTRQLANQLRSAFNNKTVAIATWPFMHSLELFTSVLSSSNCHESLSPLIYPVTMVAMGVAQFLSNFSAAFVPARLHVVRMLIEVAMETNTYIPLSPILLEILESNSSGKVGGAGGGAKGGVGKSPSLLCTLKLKKNQIGSKTTQSSILNWCMELLIKLLSGQSHLISYPEMSFPTIARLRRIVKSSSISWFNHHIKQIIEKSEETSKLLMKERSEVTFSPKDKEQVESWEREHKAVQNPLKSFYETWVAVQRQLEETEQEEEEEELGVDESGEEDVHVEESNKKKRKAKEINSTNKRQELSSCSSDDEKDRIEEFELSSNDDSD